MWLACGAHYCSVASRVAETTKTVDAGRNIEQKQGICIAGPHPSHPAPFGTPRGRHPPGKSMAAGTQRRHVCFDDKQRRLLRSGSSWPTCASAVICGVDLMATTTRFPIATPLRGSHVSHLPRYWQFYIFCKVFQIDFCLFFRLPTHSCVHVVPGQAKKFQLMSVSMPRGGTTATLYRRDS